MNTVDELLVYGQQVIAVEEQNAEADKVRREMLTKLKLERAEDALLEAFEIDREFFAEFKPGAVEDLYSHRLGFVVTLHYLNHELQIHVYEMNTNANQLKVEVQHIQAESPRAALAKWMVDVRQDFEEKKREVMRVLNEESGLITFYGDYTWQAMNRRMIWYEPEVVEARIAYLLEHRPTRNYRETKYFILWLEAAEVLKEHAPIGDILDQVKLDQKYVEDRDQLLSMLADRRDPVTGERRESYYDEDYGLINAPVTVEEIAHYQAAIDEAGIWTEEIVQALARFHQALDDQMVKEEREIKRAALETEGFFPFRYYDVEYGVLAADDDGKLKIEVDGFLAVSDTPDAQGYFTKMNGVQVKPVQVVTITRRECLTREDLSGRLVRHVVTEFGEIRVPPVGVERINS